MPRIDVHLDPAHVALCDAACEESDVSFGQLARNALAGLLDRPSLTRGESGRKRGRTGARREVAVTERQMELLRKASRQRGVPVVQLVRVALAQYLGEPAIAERVDRRGGDRRSAAFRESR